MVRPGLFLPLLIASVLASSCATRARQAEVPAAVPEVKPGLLRGYLPVGALPHGLLLLPPPPASKSAAMAADEEAARKPHTPARIEQAARDAELRFPRAAESFTCALNASIGPESTPHLYMLLRRSMTDSTFSTWGARDHYQRARPSVELRRATCTPQEEALLRNEASYPSAHASIGWTWALLLAQLAPEKSDALFARGMSFGQSGVVCGTDWQSDVNAGRVIGAATLARLNSDAGFKAEMEMARREVQNAWDSGKRPTRDCRAEERALR